MKEEDEKMMPVEQQKGGNSNYEQSQKFFKSKFWRKAVRITESVIFLCQKCLHEHLVQFELHWSIFDRQAKR